MKDVIVLLPGIMGSALDKDGTTVWDTSVGAFGRALFSLGASVQALALESDTSTGDGVSAENPRSRHGARLLKTRGTTWPTRSLSRRSMASPTRRQRV